jgi:hypothetical protein
MALILNYQGNPMNHLFRSIIVALMLIPFSAQAAKYLPKLIVENPNAKVAIVSISANNFGGSLQGWSDANSTDLMTSRLNSMLEFAETNFPKGWEVVPANSFATKPEFVALAGEQRDVGAPMFDGIYMPLLSKDRKQLVKAMIDKDVALALIDVTGADFLVIIYSEWATKTGRFSPTTKPLTKNVISIYDNAGKQEFAGRIDKMGKKTLGAFGAVYVDEDTIDYWVASFQDSLAAMYAGRKK